MGHHYSGCCLHLCSHWDTSTGVKMKYCTAPLSWVEGKYISKGGMCDFKLGAFADL